MSETRIIQQPAKWFQPDHPLANVLMPVEPRAASGFGVVAMPHPNISEADGGIQLGQGLLHSASTHDVIAGHVNVASVNAGCYRQYSAQTLENLCHVLERAAQ